MESSVESLAAGVACDIGRNTCSTQMTQSDKCTRITKKRTECA